MTTALDQPTIPSPLPKEPVPGEVFVEDDAEISPIPRPRVRQRSIWRDVRETVLMVVAIYTFVNLVAPRYIVEGRSMQPNFETGEWIIVSRLPYLLGQPQRGDVVILDFPEPQEDLIKRLIGKPGETIAIHDGLVFVDGVPLHEPYINELPRYNNEWTLGPDEYFVLGDNRNNSRDSHVFGPITMDRIIGKAWIIYWPPPNWGFVPAQTYGSPPVPTPTPTPSPVTPTAIPSVTPTPAVPSA